MSVTTEATMNNEVPECALSPKTETTPEKSSPKAKQQRPDRTTMPGMIYNANSVLDKALEARAKRPKFAKMLANSDLKGVVMMSVVEAGFFFSGNVGSGILVARQGDGTWSEPSAIGLTGVGWGFIAGASLKEVMIFLFDDASVMTMAGDAGLKFGGQAEVTLGPFGRSGDVMINASNKGVGGTASISFSKGAFGGISLEGALVGPRSAVNESFYGKPVAPKDILYEGAVTLPEGTLMPQVYAKLDKLFEQIPEDVPPKIEEEKKEEELSSEEK